MNIIYSFFFMTYSIVARDKGTGDMGIAVQTHWFGVGDNVPWVKSGIGAIATQALTEMRYGYDGLALLEDGKTPEEVLSDIGSKDEIYESRQVGIIDNDGNTASHTGNDCVTCAGSIIGDNFVIQGNILTNDEVLNRMKETYLDNLHEPLPERLLLTLQAGQDAGGELRGQQSSALYIVSNKEGEIPKINLKVDNSITPIKDLQESLKMKRGYDFLMEAEEEGAGGSIEKSLALFQKAKDIMPDNKEVLFWEASMLYNRGKEEESKEIFESHFKGAKNWNELWERITL